jgi:hypothetical protein
MLLMLGNIWNIITLIYHIDLVKMENKRNKSMGGAPIIVFNLASFSHVKQHNDSIEYCFRLSSR